MEAPGGKAHRALGMDPTVYVGCSRGCSLSSWKMGFESFKVHVWGQDGQWRVSGCGGGGEPLFICLKLLESESQEDA